MDGKHLEIATSSRVTDHNGVPARPVPRELLHHGQEHVLVVLALGGQEAQQEDALENTYSIQKYVCDIQNYVWSSIMYFCMDTTYFCMSSYYLYGPDTLYVYGNAHETHCHTA